MPQSNQPQSIDSNNVKALPNPLAAVATFALLLVGVAVFYSLAYVPFQKSRVLSQCLSASEISLQQKKEGIDKEIKSSFELRDSVEIEVNQQKAEFLKNNPEPVYNGETVWSQTFESNEHTDWRFRGRVMLRPLDDLNRKISGLQKDLEIIKTEKEDQDSKCYKLHK